MLCYVPTQYINIFLAILYEVYLCPSYVKGYDYDPEIENPDIGNTRELFMKYMSVI